MVETFYKTSLRGYINGFIPGFSQGCAKIQIFRLRFRGIRDFVQADRTRKNNCTFAAKNSIVECCNISTKSIFLKYEKSLYNNHIVHPLGGIFVRAVGNADVHRAHPDARHILHGFGNGLLNVPGDLGDGTEFDWALEFAQMATEAPFFFHVDLLHITPPPRA